MSVSFDTFEFQHMQDIKRIQKSFKASPNKPKYNHTRMGVINPDNHMEVKVPSHIPPKVLTFDGATLNPARRPEAKELPGHLTNPPIDEDALMRVRAKEKAQKDSARKKSSRGKMKIPIQVKKAE